MKTQSHTERVQDLIARFMKENCEGEGFFKNRI